MKLNLLLYSSFIFLFGFTWKDKPKDVEQLLNSNELLFGKTDSSDVVRIFGTDFDFNTSWKHAKMAGSGDWNWSYYYFDYKKEGIQIELTRYNHGKEYRLSRIRLYSNYKFSVLDDIYVDKTKFKELIKKYSIDETCYSRIWDQYKFKNVISVMYKNYRFNIDSKNAPSPPKDISYEDQTNFYKQIIINKKIEIIDIVREME